MKFETPKMEIAMFAVENVVTTSTVEGSQTVEEAKAALINADSRITAANTVTFTF